VAVVVAGVPDDGASMRADGGRVEQLAVLGVWRSVADESPVASSILDAVERKGLSRALAPRQRAAERPVARADGGRKQPGGVW